jgi:hypothetical protein
MIHGLAKRTKENKNPSENPYFPDIFLLSKNQKKIKNPLIKMIKVLIILLKRINFIAKKRK